MFPQNPLAHAQAWIDAWNRHDLDGIVAFYSPTCRFRAPSVVTRWNRPDGVLHGREELRKQFSMGLGRSPKLHFTLLHVLTGVDSMIVVYRRDNGSVVLDAVTFSPDGLYATVDVGVDQPYA
jgi:SnoaL-like domain